METRHTTVTWIIQAVSWLGLAFGLIGVLVLSNNGSDEFRGSTDPTLSPAMGFATAGVIILQWALLQAVALGLDHLACMNKTLKALAPASPHPATNGTASAPAPQVAPAPAPQFASAPARQAGDGEIQCECGRLNPAGKKHCLFCDRSLVPVLT